MVGAAATTPKLPIMRKLALALTGAAAAVANLLSRSSRGSPKRAYLLLLLATMVLSGFVNNTPLILILLPLVLGLSVKLGEPLNKTTAR